MSNTWLRTRQNHLQLGFRYIYIYIYVSYGLPASKSRWFIIALHTKPNHIRLGYKYTCLIHGHVYPWKWVVSLEADSASTMFRICMISVYLKPSRRCFGFARSAKTNHRDKQPGHEYTYTKIRHTIINQIIKKNVNGTLHVCFMQAGFKLSSN